MFSELTIYAKIPFNINDNYIIEDINDYLSNKEKLIYTRTRFQRVGSTTIKIPLDNREIEYFKYYNYAVIKAENYPTAYYFINKIEWAAENLGIITLDLDILNTYSGIQFTNKTYIKRESLDRFANVTIRNKYLYFLRKFYLTKEEDEVPCFNIVDYNLYGDKIPDRYIQNNYWVKLIIKDKYQGIKILLLPYSYNFNIQVDELNKERIIGLINLPTVVVKDTIGFDMLAILMQSENIQSMSIIPYPFSNVLVDVGSTDTLLVHINDLKPYEFYKYNSFVKIDDYEIPIIFNAIEVKFRDMFNITDQINLVKCCDYTNIISLDNVFFNLFICQLSDKNDIRNKLKNDFVDNGLFKNYLTDEIRDSTNYYLVNEPGILNDNYFKLDFNFQGVSIPFNLYDININIDNLDEYYRERERSDFNVNLVDVIWKNYFINNGGSLIFKSTKFANIKTPECPLSFKFLMPNYSGKSLYSFEDRKDEIEIANTFYWSRWGQQLSISEKGFSVIPNLLKLGGSTLLDTIPGKIGAVGLGIGALSAMIGPAMTKTFVASAAKRFGFVYLLRQFMYQQPVYYPPRINLTNFEEALLNKDLKVSLKIDMTNRVTSIENDYYFQGYPSMHYGIPNHNYRRFFDYLEADIDIASNIACNTDIITNIKNLYNKGVYYIHKTNIGYKFPRDYVENIENSIINKL